MFETDEFGMTDEQFQEMYEEAYIAACELVGPNAYEFESVLRREQAKRGIDP